MANYHKCVKQLSQLLTDVTMFGLACVRLCRSWKAVRAAMKADAEDAIDNMTLIDNIYRTAGLPVRQPTSVFLNTAAEFRQLVPPGKDK